MIAGKMTARVASHACVLVLALVLSSCTHKSPLPRLEPAQRASLTAWLDVHGQPPRDYVVGLFARHDVVFLGECHRVKHDVLFVPSLFRPLYDAGVRTFATEFARREDQRLIDSLMAAPEWHEELGRRIVFNQYVEWGYEEYVGLFRAAWELNHSLPPGVPCFRVLGVNDSPDWSVVKTEADLDDPKVKAQVWRGGGERFWAEVILQAVASGQKVLVYSGMHHAFTAFRQPIVSQGKFIRFEDERMGNYVCRALGKRAVTVFLHAPWAGSEGYGDRLVYPGGGILDALMLGLPSGPRSVGFDLEGSPFGEIRPRDTVYAAGYDDFRVSMFCDGWIYFTPLSASRGVTPIRDWINPDNLAQARLQTGYLPARGFSVAQYNAMIAQGADATRHWPHLR
jgi:hypothetical protein